MTQAWQQIAREGREGWARRQRAEANARLDEWLTLVRRGEDMAAAARRVGYRAEPRALRKAALRLGRADVVDAYDALVNARRGDTAEDRRRRNRPRLTPEDLARMESLLDDGASLREAARTFGVSDRTVRHHFPGRGWTVQQRTEYLRTLRELNPGDTSADPITTHWHTRAAQIGGTP